MSKTILITGGMGFIGSNFIRHYHQNHPEDDIVNLDKLTYSANPENLKDHFSPSPLPIYPGAISWMKTCSINSLGNFLSGR